MLTMRELGDILSDARDKAPHGMKTVTFHLFCIEYAHILKQMLSEDIITMLYMGGMSYAVKTEVNDMLKIAEKVTLNSRL